VEVEVLVQMLSPTAVVEEEQVGQMMELQLVQAVKAVMVVLEFLVLVVAMLEEGEVQVQME
jgi:hypothetical protein